MKLDQNIMFVRLSFSMPRQSRKVTAQADIDPRRLRASARLYSGESFKKIKSADAETRNLITTLAIRIPSAFKGCYVLPAALVDKVLSSLEQARDERNSLVNSFIESDYETERQQAREALKDSFRDDDFPEPATLREQFEMKWSIFRLDVPDGLPDDVRQAELEKFQGTMSSVAEECRQALRETMAELVGHLADRLKPDADGTRKRLCKSTVENLREFLDTVNARDITSDTEIQSLSEKAKNILANYSADDLKKGAGARVQAGLEQVKRDIDGLIEREGKRKIDLDID